jgi:AraC-like DNA-binding protein
MRILPSGLPEHVYFVNDPEDTPTPLRPYVISNAIKAIISNHRADELIQYMPAARFDVWEHNLHVTRYIRATPDPSKPALHLHVELTGERVSATLPHKEKVALKSGEVNLFYLSQQLHTAMLKPSDQCYTFFHLEFDELTLTTLLAMGSKYSKTVADFLHIIKEAKKAGSALINQSPVEIDSYMLSLIENIRNVEAEEHVSMIYRDKQCMLFLEAFVRSYAERNEQNYCGLTTEELKAVDSIKKLIRLRLSEITAIDVEILCVLHGITPKIFLCGFKMMNIISIGDFITNIRMEQAVTLLLERKLTISQIARATGFAGKAIFINSFENYFGYSPDFFRL